MRKVTIKAKLSKLSRCSTAGPHWTGRGQHSERLSDEKLVWAAAGPAVPPLPLRGGPHTAAGGRAPPPPRPPPGAGRDVAGRGLRQRGQQPAGQHHLPQSGQQSAAEGLARGEWGVAPGEADRGEAGHDIPVSDRHVSRGAAPDREDAPSPLGGST